jgi:hypothetical protein
MRTLDEKRHEDTAGPVFSRFFVEAFLMAARIGLVIGIIATIAALWHVHVHRLW